MEDFNQRILDAIKENKDIVTLKLTALENVTAKLVEDFNRFKDVCHDRQHDCRSELHTRINNLSDRQSRLNGFHQRNTDDAPRKHERSTVNQLKDYWPYILMFIAVGAVLGEHLIIPALQYAVGGGK